MTKIANVLIIRFFVILYMFDFLIMETRNDVPYNYDSEKKRQFERRNPRQSQMHPLYEKNK